ncbi:MAG: restriction endonuclease subunit S [Bacteroidetes bacterium]|nr:restriction endonuclease subunit S [Bacteroidota bacterium]
MDNGQWINVSLNNYVDAYAGGTPSRFVSEFYGGTIPWISSGEVNQPYITDTVEKITEEGLKNSSAKWIPKGSVLIAMYGATAGQISKTKIDATSNQAVLAIVPKDGAINPDYLYYLLKHNKNNLLQLTRGSAQPNLNKNLIVNYPLSIVNSLPAQRHIASILSTADAVIEKTQAAIVKYKAIKQGMLQDLFTRGIDPQTGKLRPRYEDAPELYKPSKLGWIPREWDCDSIDNLTDKVGSGVTPTGGSEVYKSEGVLFLRSQNILYGKLTLNDVAFIPEEIDEIMDNSRVRPFDVLLNITGASIGRCAFFPKELGAANVNQHVCIIRFKNATKASALFTSEYLNTDFGQRQMYKAMAIGNREGLNYQQIKSFNLPKIETTEELVKISSIIESINNKLQTGQTYLQKMQSIKKGLMEDLLSGKVKVKSGKLVDEVTEKVTEHN